MPTSGVRISYGLVLSELRPTTKFFSTSSTFSTPVLKFLLKIIYKLVTVTRSVKVEQHQKKTFFSRYNCANAGTALIRESFLETCKQYIVLPYQERDMRLKATRP